ncbi:MAG: helix-turn-helix domain-containing protein [Bacteroides sp.]
MNTCNKRATNCSLCTQSNRSGLIQLHHYPQRTHFPAEKQSCNFILFILRGNMLINSEEYPDMILQSEHAVLQANGSKVELLAITDVDCIELRFNDVPAICRQNFQEIVDVSINPITYTPLPFNEKLQGVIDDLVSYLSEPTPPCHAYLELKSKELIYVITNYYPQHLISAFFYPISIYTESFQYFVMKHYAKVRTTEEFAHLGGYTTTTFRRLFKNLYGMPVYVWILNKRRESILHDLLQSDDRIGVISERYGFDNLSHFSHFCKDSFGDTPRTIRKRAAAGETITIISRDREGGKQTNEEEE